MDLVDLLNEKGINYKKSNNPSEILITCTSGEHVDKDPSLSYNLEKDMFHCWSCGFKGSKRKFLESIGISSEITFETKQAFKIQKLKNKSLYSFFHWVEFDGNYENHKFDKSVFSENVYRKLDKPYI